MVTNADQEMGGEKKERKAKHPWLENWLQLVTKCCCCTIFQEMCQNAKSYCSVIAYRTILDGNQASAWRILSSFDHMTNDQILEIC